LVQRRGELLGGSVNQPTKRATKGSRRACADFLDMNGYLDCD
jgi:hypothetical protein